MFCFLLVAFNASSFELSAGETGYIECSAVNIANLTSIVISRSDGNSTSTEVASITIGSAEQYNGKADAQLSSVQEGEVKLVAKFEPVKCTDIDMATGMSTYTCTVTDTENNVLQDNATVKVQRK